METITDFENFSFSTKVALISFAIGTLLFGCYFIAPEKDNLLIRGLCYVLFAALVNGIVLLYLLYQFLTLPEERTETSIRILLLLANIPIAFLYFFTIINAAKHYSLY